MSTDAKARVLLAIEAQTAQANKQLDTLIKKMDRFEGNNKKLSKSFIDLRKKTESFNDGLKRLGITEKQLTDLINKHNSAKKQSKKNTEQLTTAVNHQRQSQKKSTDSTKLATAAVLAMNTALYASVKAAKVSADSFIEFEATMRSVNSITLESEASYKRAFNEVRRFTKDKEVVQGANEIAKGLVPISQAGFNMAESLQLAELSAKGATAAVTDVTTVSEGLAKMMNTFKDQGRDIEAAKMHLDDFFTAQKYGMATVEQIIQAMPKANTAMQQLGESSEVGLAAIIELTKVGFSAPQATTRIAALATSLQKASDKTKETAKEFYGLDLSMKHIKEVGLIDFLKEVDEALRGDAEALGVIFKEQRAREGAFNLMAQGAKGFADSLNKLKNNAGDTQDALNEITKSTKTTLQQIDSILEDIKIGFGEIVVDVFRPFIDGLRDSLAYISELDEATKKTIVQLGLFGFTLGTVLSTLLSINIALKVFLGLNLVTALVSIRNAILSMSIATSGAAAPWLALAGAIGFTATKVYELIKAWNQLKIDIDNVDAQIMEASKQTVSYTKTINTLKDKTNLTAKEQRELAIAYRQVAMRFAEGSEGRKKYIALSEKHINLSKSENKDLVEKVELLSATKEELEKLIKAGKLSRDNLAKSGYDTPSKKIALGIIEEIEAAAEAAAEEAKRKAEQREQEYLSFKKSLEREKLDLIKDTLKRELAIIDYNYKEKEKLAKTAEEKADVRALKELKKTKARLEHKKDLEEEAKKKEEKQFKDAEKEFKIAFSAKENELEEFAIFSEGKEEELHKKRIDLINDQIAFYKSQKGQESKVLELQHQKKMMLLEEEKRLKDLAAAEEKQRQQNENDYHEYYKNEIKKEKEDALQNTYDKLNEISSATGFVADAFKDLENDSLNAIGDLLGGLNAIGNKVISLEKMVRSGDMVTILTESIKEFGASLASTFSVMEKYNDLARDAETTQYQWNELISDQLKNMPWFGKELSGMVRGITDGIGLTISEANQKLLDNALKALDDWSKDVMKTIDKNLEAIEKVSDSAWDKVKKDLDKNENIFKDTGKKLADIAKKDADARKEIQKANEDSYKKELDLLDKIIGQKVRKLQSAVDSEIEIIKSRDARIRQLEQDRQLDREAKQKRQKAFNEALANNTKSASFFRQNAQNFETGKAGNQLGNDIQRKNLQDQFDSGAISYDEYAAERQRIGLEKFQFYQNQAKLYQGNPAKNREMLDKAKAGQAEFFEFVFDKEKETIDLETRLAKQRKTEKEQELRDLTSFQQSEIAKLDQAYFDSSGNYKSYFVNKTRDWVSFAQTQVKDISNTLMADIQKANSELNKLQQKASSLKSSGTSSGASGSSSDLKTSGGMFPSKYITSKSGAKYDLSTNKISSNNVAGETMAEKIARWKREDAELQRIKFGLAAKGGVFNKPTIISEFGQEEAAVTSGMMADMYKYVKDTTKYYNNSASNTYNSNTGNTFIFQGVPVNDQNMIKKHIDSHFAKLNRQIPNKK